MIAHTILSDLDPNSLNVLSIIHRNGPVTMTMLMEITKVPRTTLNRSIKELLDRQLLLQEATELSSGGRPPSVFSVNPEGLFMVGIELSRSNIRTVLSNLALEPLWICDLQLDRSSHSNDVLGDIVEMIDAQVKQLILEPKRFLGIGIGSVGPLDLKQGLLLNPAGFPNSSWHNLHLQNIFEGHFPVPAFVANGASTAVMGEYANRITRGIQNVIYLNIGVGIRCGVILKGALLNGSEDSEGSFAHIIVEPGGLPCYCGKFGCIESYASLSAVVNQFQHGIRKGRNSILMSNRSLETIEFRDICTAARNGDPLSVQVLEESATYMGIVVANIINVLHPQMIVIGGLLPDSSELFYERTVSTARKQLYNPGHQNCVFAPPSLGNNTIALGAAAYVLSNYLWEGGVELDR